MTESDAGVIVKIGQKLSGVLRYACIPAFAMAMAVGFGSETASAAVHIGGSDAVSDYDWDGSDGVFSFANAPVGMEPNLPGFVSSDDIVGYDLTNVDGSGGLAQVAFNIVLGENQNTSTGNGSVFNPTATNGTGNIKKAQFLGPMLADMIIYKPVSGSPNMIDEILLTFDLVFLDVTNATKKQVDPLPPFTVIDPDGSITLGDATEGATTTSLMYVSGGTLAPLVGGIGSEATMSILISTLTPIIPDTAAAFRGYFGQDWTSGVGPEPIAGLAFDITILPAVPEPSTASLLAMSLLGLSVRGRFKPNRRVR